MKRIITSVLVLVSAASLSGCSGSYADAPEPQNKPSISDIKTSDLYKATQYDENGLSHWVFDQKLPNGKTITCVAVISQSHHNPAISCLPETLTADTAAAAQ